MDLIYIANKPEHVEMADASGVDRVMVDLEVNGKIERQGHLDTVISRHTLDDVASVASLLKNAKLMVRVNPLNAMSKVEVNEVLDNGAEILMLPMFKTVETVERFIKINDGRAKVCLLFETAEALARAPRILDIEGIDEVHIGLNDLHLSLGLEFMFELLSGGIVEYLATLLKQRKLKYGFGGIARINTGILPAEKILGEHVRLGSSMVILSRDFQKISLENEPLEKFANQVRLLRNYEAHLRSRSREDLELNKSELAEIVDKIVSSKLSDVR